MPVKKNYRELNDQLETILHELQASDIDIDQALELYEKGQRLIKKLENYLQAADNTIIKLEAASKKSNKQKL